MTKGLPATLEEAEMAAVEAAAVARACRYVRMLKSGAISAQPLELRDSEGAAPWSWFGRENSRAWVKDRLKALAAIPQRASFVCGLARDGLSVADEALREIIVEHKERDEKLLTSLRAYDIEITQAGRRRRGGWDTTEVVLRNLAILCAYLAASSRLCRRNALCLLRRGAAAGGKNFLVSNALRLIPDEAVIHMTSGSPLSLVYYGDGDEDAFKHKAIYIPEAAVLAERNGVESPLTFMLRTLISEGRLDHHVVMTQANGPPVSTHVKRNGPVVVIITTARDNVEDELLTRLVMSDADETGKQTKAVLKGVLAKEVRRVDEEEIRPWLDFQRWLETDAPYEVVIPFRESILAAFNELWDEMRTVPLRIRRDVNALITAIETSAILHRAQREKDAAGRTIATLDDYGHAHAAFDAGLAALYRTKIPDTALAVVKAAEAVGATDAIGVKITVSALMGKLGITGRGVAASRLNHAEECGFLKLVDTGKGGARTYEFGKTSAEVAALIESGSAGQCVFPKVEDVKKHALNRSVPPSPLNAAL